MMRINLLKCFPHRFTKHYDRKSGNTYAICLRCSKLYQTTADYRTPSAKWYDWIDNLTARMDI